jgi:hypothetical protein
MKYKRVGIIAWCVLLVVTTPVWGAQLVVFQYDQFSSDPITAVREIQGETLGQQAGFAQGEAFGQLYRPLPNSYPVKILGIDMFLGSPPLMGEAGQAEARIEVWAHAGQGADPMTGEPLFAISTEDLFNQNTGDFGMPLEGDTAFSVTFDWSDPANHPPYITSGNFMVVVRFLDAAQDLQFEWGNAQCMSLPDVGMCGCQEVSVIQDQAITTGVNVLHILTPGTCTGDPVGWYYGEAVGLAGDVLIRVHAEIADCIPNCHNIQCGDDGCGGECGPCPAGSTCEDVTSMCIADEVEGDPDLEPEIEPEVEPPAEEETQFDPDPVVEEEPESPAEQADSLICEPGAYRCRGNAIESCNRFGEWGFYRDCSLDGLICSEGACIQEIPDEDPADIQAEQEPETIVEEDPVDSVEPEVEQVEPELEPESDTTLEEEPEIIVDEVSEQESPVDTVSQEDGATSTSLCGSMSAAWTGWLAMLGMWGVMRKNSRRRRR